MGARDHPRWRRAVLLMGQSRTQLAERELRQFLVDEPNHSRGHALLALCLASLDSEAATDEAHLAIHLAPDDAFAHRTLAIVMHHKNRYREAEQSIREAIRLEPNSSTNYETLARIHFAQSRWADALAAAERGLSADPSDVDCANLRALTLVNLGELAEAQAVTEWTLVQHPENSVTHASRGWALLANGASREALGHFREALRIEPNDDSSREGVVEALKRQNPFYRAALTASLWLSQGGIRFQCLVGLIAISIFSLALEIIEKNPKHTSRVTLFLVPYAIAVAFVWAPDAAGRVLLRLHRNGRQALSREQIIAANCVGVALAGAIMLIVAAVLARESSPLIGALTCGAIIHPLSSIFDCDRGRPRYFAIAITVALALLGIAIFVVAAPFSPVEVEGVQGLVILFLVAAVLSKVAANILVGQVAKK